MKHALKSARRWFRSELGVSMVEYAVLIALIGALALSAIASVGSMMDRNFRALGTTIGAAGD